jgi:hypothetical protein
VLSFAGDLMGICRDKNRFLALGRIAYSRCAGLSNGVLASLGGACPYER